VKLFNKCLWHDWVYKSVYYDCSDICFWSSGTEYYRQCKDCKETQKLNNDIYVKTTDKFIINQFKG
jgi:hypothetical protein